MPYTAGPFDSAHLYLNWGGKLPGLETWSVGVRLRKLTGATVEGDGAFALAVASGPIAAFHQRAETSLSQAAKLSFVKCNAIGTNGRYLGSGSNDTVFPDLPGNATNAQPVNQLAIAATLETGFSRGPAHRGRIYLPMPVIGIYPDGLIAPENAALVATSCNTLLQELHTALGAMSSPYEVAVYSRKLGAAGNRRVTEFKVGRALDTQRRRRRSLAENYQLQTDFELAG